MFECHMVMQGHHEMGNSWSKVIEVFATLEEAERARDFLGKGSLFIRSQKPEYEGYLIRASKPDLYGGGPMTRISTK